MVAFVRSNARMSERAREQENERYPTDQRTRNYTLAALRNPKLAASLPPPQLPARPKQSYAYRFCGYFQNVFKHKNAESAIKECNRCSRGRMELAKREQPLLASLAGLAGLAGLACGKWQVVSAKWQVVTDVRSVHKHIRTHIATHTNEYIVIVSVVLGSFQCDASFRRTRCGTCS